MLAIPKSQSLLMLSLTWLSILLCTTTIYCSETEHEHPLESVSLRQRAFILTDIANEPDDMMSLTRFLLYSNHFYIQGIAATTSTWLRNQTFPDQIERRIRLWHDVRQNLTQHATGWPQTGRLLARTYAGPPLYGMEGVGSGMDSNASLALEKAVDEASDKDPLWVLVWGGANVLAQALWNVKNSRADDQITHFISKLRIYSISDQDDSGPWIRQTFPTIFYIFSYHAFNMYNQATWVGISGEKMYNVDRGGPDSSLVSHDWLNMNIRNQANSFSTTYPRHQYIMEGDTPSFLYLIQNGLSVPEHPHWGSWGGRYGRTARTNNMWVDTVDTDVEGHNKELFTSNHATIWRWRKAYQNDFAARMAWTSTSDYKAVNHNPILILNKSKGQEPIYYTLKPGAHMYVDGSQSYDPDENEVEYRWWQYVDASSPQRDLETVPRVDIQPREKDRRSALLTVPSRWTLEDPKYSEWIMGTGSEEYPLLHIILEAWDNGFPEMVSYRRIVLNVTGLDVEEAARRRKIPGEL